MKCSENKRTIWSNYILGLIAIVFVFYHRLNMAVLSPYIIQTFVVSNTLLGLLSSVYFYAYGSLQPIVGFLVDKWKPRKVLTLFLLLMSLGTFIFAYSPNYFFLFLGRFLIGVGCAGISIPVTWMVTKYFDYSKRGVLFSIIVVTENIGAILATSPFEKLIYLYKWRNALGITAFMAFFLSLLFFIFLRNNNNNKEIVKYKKKKESWATIFKTTLNKPIIKYFLITFLSSASLISLQGLWAIPFLIDIYDIEKNIASNFVSLIPIGKIIGILIFARINDTKYNKYVFFIAMFLSSVLYLIFAVFINKISNNTITVMFFLIGFFQGTFIPFMIKIISFFLPKKTFGTSIGIINLFRIVLSGLFPSVTGFLFDSIRGSNLLVSTNLMSYKVYFYFLFINLALVTWASTHIIKIINLSEIRNL